MAPEGLMGFAPLILGAWAIEAAVGWPAPVYRWIGHPVAWLGGLVTQMDRALNRPEWPHAVRYGLGGLSAVLIVCGVAGLAAWLAHAIPPTPAGQVVEAVLASSLIASRSLYAHVANVARPLASGDIETARAAVAMIVGRDPAQLDDSGVARAALESLSENMSDGVIAPIFWGLLFGLPGLAAYKAVNTMDSMIGHRTDRHAAFGGVAARLDDVANLVPARLTGLLVSAAACRAQAFTVMRRDARRHRSPNAGWPEAAMAGALGVRLSGPRQYGGHTSVEPWLNEGAPDPAAEDLQRGLRLYVRGCALAAALIAILVAARCVA